MMKSRGSTGNLFADRIKQMAKRNESDEDESSARDGLSLLDMDYGNRHHDNNYAEWENDLSKLTPASRRKKLSILQSFRRKKLQAKRSDNSRSPDQKQQIPFVPFAFALANRPDDGDEKSNPRQEEASRMEYPATSKDLSVAQSLRQTLKKSFSKRRMQNEDESRKYVDSLGQSETSERIPGVQPERIRTREGDAVAQRKTSTETMNSEISFQNSPTGQSSVMQHHEPRRRTRTRKPANNHRKASVETNNSEDSTIYSMLDDQDTLMNSPVSTMAMEDATSAWMEIVFQDLPRGSSAEISEQSQSPQNIEKLDSTGTTIDGIKRHYKESTKNNGSHAENMASSRVEDNEISNEGIASAGNDRQPDTIVALKDTDTIGNKNVKSLDPDNVLASSTSKKTKMSPQPQRRSRSLGMSPHSIHRKASSSEISPGNPLVSKSNNGESRRRSKRSVSLSGGSPRHRCSPRFDGENKSQFRRRGRKSVVCASQSPKQMRKSLPTLSLDGDAQPLSPPRSTSLGSRRIALSGGSPRPEERKSSSVSGSPGRRRRKKIGSEVGALNPSNEKSQQERDQGKSRSQSRNKSKRRDSHSGASKKSSKSRRSKQQQQKKSEKAKVKKEDPAPVLEENNLYGAVPECPSVGSASGSASAFSDYVGNALITPQTDRTVLLPSGSPSDSQEGLDELLGISRHDDPREHSDAKSDDNVRRRTLDIPRFGPSNRYARWRDHSDGWEDSNESSGGHRRIASDTPVSSSSPLTKPRPGMPKKALSHRSLSVSRSPQHDGRYVGFKEKAAREASSNSRRSLVDIAIDSSLSRLSLPDEDSVATPGLDQSVHSLFFDSMED
eukprot:scaffold4180_cov99-Cylindrotheca_fusiformis.AAC.13